MKNYISVLRKRHGYNQEDFGTLFNASRSTVGSWENGRTDPSLETLVEISKRFNVSIDWLLTGNEHKLSSREMDILHHLRELDEAQQESIYEIIRSIKPNK